MLKPKAREIMIIKNFVVFEGIDGAGTTTQLNAIKEALLPKGSPALFTAEPTKAETGKFLRRMLKGDVKLTKEGASYLFAADRNEHVEGDLVIEEDGRLVTGIKKACEKGKIVISDRYLFSSLAYQSVDCDPTLPRALNSFFPLPNLLFFFDIEPEVSLERIKSRDEKEIYEKLDFLKKANDEYKKILIEYSKEKGEGMKIIRVDATLPKEKITEKILSELDSVYKIL